MTITLLTHKQRSSTDEDGKITVTVPIRMVKKGKTHILSAVDSAPMLFEQPEVKNNIVKALVTAFRWKSLLDSGEASSMRDIADKEKIGDNYVSRLLKLSLLAPDIVEAILNGKQPKTLDLVDMTTFMPMDWNEQRRKFGFPTIPNNK